MIGNPDSVGPARSSAPETRDREAAFVALKDATRRAVLRHLDPDEGWIALADLAARVADDARSPDGARNPGRVAVALHHNHLPKLDECGLVRYDHRANRVAATDAAWAEPYLGLFER